MEYDLPRKSADPGAPGRGKKSPAFPAPRPDASAFGWRSVYADRSGDAFLRMLNRTAHADALHQVGRRAEAEARFGPAEQMQAERQPAFRLLYSQQGFIYCDLLLTEAERAAWLATLECGGSTPLSDIAQRPFFLYPRSPGIAHVGEVESHAAKESGSAASQSGVEPPHSKALRDVAERAAQTLQWEQGRLLDIALDHLTLGRAALYAAILDQSKIENPKSQIDQAVIGLRRAGQSDELPKALLTRAWLRSLTGARTGPESAQSDLDEAWEIAERGPMKLFMADIHLYRARLFFREAVYPWESPAADLAAAEKLINDCGYHRRDEELADAKAVIAAASAATR